MIRSIFFILPVLLACAYGFGQIAPALAASSHKASSKHESSSKHASKAEEKKAKPVQVATYGDWGAFLAEAGKEKTCYALAQPKERDPASLRRDPAYVFISTRPGENIRNEVSIIMGFKMKDGGDAQAEVGDASFDLISKGTNAWVKNPAKEGELIEAMKKGAKLVVKAASARGKMTTDSYSLSGLTQALDRVRKECR
jgi:hypothetical protein